MFSYLFATCYVYCYYAKIVLKQLEMVAVTSLRRVLMVLKC